MSVKDVDEAQPEGRLEFKDYLLTYVFAFNFGATALGRGRGGWSHDVLDRMVDGLRKRTWSPFNLDINDIDASYAVKKLVERYIEPEEELGFITIQRRWKSVMPPLRVTLRPKRKANEEAPLPSLDPGREPMRAVPVLTIHESGVAYIALFMGNAGGQCSAEDLMDFVESFEELRVGVELSEEYRNALSQASHALGMACLDDFPCDASRMGGKRWRCSVYFPPSGCLNDLLLFGRGGSAA